MNTIPYFGPTVVAIAAFVFGFVQFDSARQATIVAMASLTITTVEGMFITPLMVSRMASMNPVAVFLGLLFWGWLWGVVGMLLAVPLLIIFKTIFAAAGTPDIAGFLFEEGTLTHVGEEEEKET